MNKMHNKKINFLIMPNNTESLTDNKYMMQIELRKTVHVRK